MKTVLITGASSGIGESLAEIFLKQGWTVIGANRRKENKFEEHTNFESVLLDLSDVQSFEEIKKKFYTENIKLDILINNAGIGPDLGHTEPEFSSFQKTIEVNFTGTVFFTEMILPFLKTNAMLINISSIMGSIDVCSSFGSPAYRMSKAALNMYTKLLSNRLTDKKVASIHPGWVRTNISKSNVEGRLSSEESAARIRQFMNGEFESGIFWDVESNEKLNW